MTPRRTLRTRRRTAAALIAGAACIVALAGCTDPIPEHAGGPANLAPPVEQPRAPANKVPPIFHVVTYPAEGTVEVIPCNSRADAAPGTIRCFINPRISRHPSQYAQAWPQDRAIPPP